MHMSKCVNPANSKLHLNELNQANLESNRLWKLLVIPSPTMKSLAALILKHEHFFAIIDELSYKSITFYSIFFSENF